MNLLRKLFAKAGRSARGQTLAEYVLIVSAIAIVAFAGYRATGTTVQTLVSTVDGQM
jgi:Flp pilus assembly pilin Flp